MRALSVIFLLLVKITLCLSMDPIPGLFDVIGDLAGKLTDSCKFSCPKGGTPKANPSHVPTSNGCGSYGIQVDLSDYPEMAACCNDHDICYDTCGEEKTDCDDDFHRCLKKVCRRMNRKGTLNDKQFRGCKSTVDLLYGGLLALGCDAYLTSQKQACTCSAKSRGTRDDL